MTKRPRKPECDSAEQWQRESKRRHERYHPRDISPLLDLISAIDITLDPKLLLSLFDDPPLTSEELTHIRPHLEDLFDRLTFKPTRKNRRPPSYMRTVQEHRLLQALDDVKNRPRGVKQAEAIAEAVQKRGVSKTALKLALEGRHSSLRRGR